MYPLNGKTPPAQCMVLINILLVDHDQEINLVILYVHHVATCDLKIRLHCVQCVYCFTHVIKQIKINFHMWQYFIIGYGTTESPK